MEAIDIETQISSSGRDFKESQKSYLPQKPVCNHG